MASIDPEHFWSKVRLAPNGECWVTGNQRSYGQYRGEAAHRVAWKLTHGAIPVGQFICHKCDFQPCVRPDHLFLGSAKDNMQDASRKGRLGASLGILIEIGDLTLAEAAELLGIQAATLRQQAQHGVLHAYRAGRDWWVSPTEIERYRTEHLRRARTEAAS